MEAKKARSTPDASLLNRPLLRGHIALYAPRGPCASSDCSSVGSGIHAHGRLAARWAVAFYALRATLRGLERRLTFHLRGSVECILLVGLFNPSIMRRSVFLALLCASGSAAALSPGNQWQAGEPMTVNVAYDVPVYGPGQERAALEEGVRFLRATQLQSQRTRRADAFMQPARAGDP